MLYRCTLRPLGASRDAWTIVLNVNASSKSEASRKSMAEVQRKHGIPFRIKSVEPMKGVK